MGLIIKDPPTCWLGDNEPAVWRDIPCAIISDELNRAPVMHAEISLISLNAARFAGHALTVDCMVGSNIAIHYALERAWPGCVIVVDGRGHKDTALIGEIMYETARTAKVGAIVIDGSVRDIACLRAGDLPIYARGFTPRGPHKGFGGEINGPIQCGGVAISAGDLLVGDDDGVVVIRKDQVEAGLMERCRKRMADEAERIRRIKAGENRYAFNPLPPPEKID